MLNDIEKNNILQKMILKKLKFYLKSPPGNTYIFPVGSRATQSYSLYSDFDFIVLYHKNKPILKTTLDKNLSVQVHYFDLDLIDELHTQTPGALVFLDSYYKHLIKLKLVLPSHAENLHFFLSGYNILKVIESLKASDKLYGKDIKDSINLRHYHHFHKYIPLFSSILTIPDNFFYQEIFYELEEFNFILSYKEFISREKKIEDSINQITKFYAEALCNKLLELIKEVSLETNIESDTMDLLNIQRIIV